ncbi:MAG: alanine--tRNA ligase [Bacteroidetes bacterium 4572_128]|nr:MAG: alanine--tRNA ligase [Bacteroidetes bacterium 4572_128]
MNSKEIRNTFLNFFDKKNHKIVRSAPMVIKNDPSLLFTNAGMNAFKDIFLSNSEIKNKRIANSQKCLRVSGKHNDLEEVGHDTYHHTMFEMLGNWSFGDYFKESAIDFAWELLVDIFKIPEEKLYATIFEGDEKDNLEEDKESQKIWEKYLPKNRILKCSKKDNFWEMGANGPCGSCSEIHIDMRTEEERKKIDGKDLVNKDHPEVIEIWNLVFIEFNRKSDGKLVNLDKKHIDTGMGFERLCRIIQNKKSNYDTDVFSPILNQISIFSGIKYGENEKTDIAMRVIADHLRTISFSIADGQLPSNNKAGYVIRRILRRAIRYAYTFLNQKSAFIFKLVPVLIETLGEVYQELEEHKILITRVIEEEENSFFMTLENGIKLLDEIVEKTKKENKNILSGKSAFKLYDTFGFPLDLTKLILKEKNFSIDLEEFKKEMQKQKDRSKNAINVENEEWIILKNNENSVLVKGVLECETEIIKYRKVRKNKKSFFQIVLTKTPFYAEEGGQVGDRGILISNKNVIKIFDTQKENNLIIHYCEKIPHDIDVVCIAKVDIKNHIEICNNHSATHLLQSSLREILGKHIEQRGSFVNSKNLRFDFSHFQKLSNNEIFQVEKLVNEKIRKDIACEIFENIDILEAKKMGATALFGEKYEDKVRVVTFDFDNNFSVELCGGSHVNTTGQIGLFKIISESSVSSGIRRIEAITSQKAQNFVDDKLKTLKDIQNLFKNPVGLLKKVENVIFENIDLKKQIRNFEKEKSKFLIKDLIKNSILINGINFIGKKIKANNANILKDLSFQLKNEKENIFVVLAAEVNGKANLSLIISENLVTERKLNAGKIIREIAKEIKGGGGGKEFFATAGGKNINGINNSIEKAKKILENI